MNNFWLFGLGMFFLLVLPILSIAHALEISPHAVLNFILYVGGFCLYMSAVVFELLSGLVKAIAVPLKRLWRPFARRCRAKKAKKFK